MKILVVTNLYPPHTIGGYEIICKEIVDYLEAQGHTVSVLTSNYKDTSSPDEKNKKIFRVLKDRNWLHHKTLRRESHKIIDLFQDVKIFNKCVKRENPDVIFVFNLLRLSPFLLPAIQNCAIKKTYYVADSWLLNYAQNLKSDKKFWQRNSHRKLRSFVKKQIMKYIETAIVPKNIEKEKFIFLSHYLKNSYKKNGISPTSSTVIHHGVYTNEYPTKNKEKNKRANLIYASQIMKHKGLHTLLKAICLLKDNTNVSLTIVGESLDILYMNEMKKFVRENGIKEKVKFIGKKNREDVIQLYQKSDIAIVPSIWKEPFGLVHLEAMACGVPVITSGTGGSSEIIQDGYDGLHFESNNSESLAKAIQCLIEDKQLYQKLSQNAKKTIIHQFNLENKLEQVNGFLCSKTSSAPKGTNATFAHIFLEFCHILLRAKKHLYQAKHQK